MDEIQHAIMNGLTFKGSGGGKKSGGKVKTKAKKRTYITGVHKSGAAKMKAAYSRQRKNRHKH